MPVFTVPIHEHGTPGEPNYPHPKGKAAGPVMNRDFMLDEEDEAWGAQIEQLIRQVARELKFPASQITVRSEEDSYEFNVGTDKLKAAATYNPETGQIDIYEIPMEGAHWAPLASILAHEIQHHRWHTVMTQYDKEMAAIKAVDDRIWDEHKDKPVHERVKQQVTNMAGWLRDAHKATYPTVAALEPFFKTDVRDRLAKEDGLSDYSRQWWTAWNTGQAKSGIRQIYNETQAEVAASLVSKKYGRNIEAPKPAWRRFYHAVNREFTRIQRGARAAA